MNIEEVLAYIKIVGENDVEFFKEDIELDLELVKMDPRVSFIHITRRSGSCMVRLVEFDVNNIKSLDQCISDKKILLEHFLEQKPITISFYDGNDIMKSNAKKVRSILEEFYKKVRSNFLEKEYTKNK